MKKPKFSLEKFAQANVRTFNSEELQLINGGAAPGGEDVMCSQSNDTDSGRNCSISSDTDSADATVTPATDTFSHTQLQSNFDGSDAVLNSGVVGGI